ncbi:XRE family transcriptional regulator [Providencia heimbachae]|uniref:helix-turn-helix transcriptional regulator n=1 Tax=Providencia heimbachae TaxID=333962 RepID=UPI0010BEC66C|nr:helix-turn-helix transcriptional regulator [Providencia heimbachae]QCJ70717.1 XRE family transcriptional regulator [Providencia heimbachae]
MKNDDLALVSLADLKSELLQDNEVQQRYLELQVRKALIYDLKSARIAKKLTQSQVADRMHTQKQNVSRLEQGEFDPKLGTLLKYAEAVGGRITVDFSQK